jgi:hypothetical protein
MGKLSNNYILRISETQSKSIETLRSYNVDVARFIRDAIKEKINRDWKSIKDEHERVKLPF